MQRCYHSGYVAFAGRPNVGKSTLLNSIMGQKISIVTSKPQTTRNRIAGIKTLENAQIILIDTPGIHNPKNILNEAMVRIAKETLLDMDVIVMITEPSGRFKADEDIISILRSMNTPVILVMNKIDKYSEKVILEFIEIYRKIYEFAEIISISALKKTGIDVLLEKIIQYLPEGPKYYPDDIVTDQIERFMAAEIIREKIMESTADEIPYSIAVDILNWDERRDNIVSISANIYVERESQKGIIIGKSGNMLKLIGTKARTDIERLLGTKVYLELWVKVKKDWRDDKNLLHELGYI